MFDLVVSSCQVSKYSTAPTSSPKTTFSIFFTSSHQVFEYSIGPADGSIAPLSIFWTSSLGVSKHSIISLWNAIGSAAMPTIFRNYALQVSSYSKAPRVQITSSGPPAFKVSSFLSGLPAFSRLLTGPTAGSRAPLDISWTSSLQVFQILYEACSRLHSLT